MKKIVPSTLTLLWWISVQNHRLLKSYEICKLDIIGIDYLAASSHSKLVIQSYVELSLAILLNGNFNSIPLINKY